jgi:hypothetical protein
MSVRILITDAGTLVKKVASQGEEVLVGEVTEASEAFVARVKRDLPHVKFDVVNEPGEAQTPTQDDNDKKAGTQGDTPAGTGATQTGKGSAA